MPNDENWVDVGPAEEFSTTPLKRVTAGKHGELAVSFKDGKFGAISNACNHVGGPLGDGRLDGDYIICPWHNWNFIVAADLANLVSKRIAFPLIRSRSIMAAYL